jgi:hypothetical protein
MGRETDSWFRVYWSTYPATGKISVVRWGPWNAGIVVEDEESETAIVRLLDLENLDQLILAMQDLREAIAKRHEAKMSDLDQVDPPNRYGKAEC